MKIKHFFNEKNINSYDRYSLGILIDECDFIYEKKLSSIIDERDDKSLICLSDNGEICGFASVEDTGKELELYAIYVGIGFKNKGYGRILLKNVIDYSKELQYDTVTLVVTKENDYAQDFYKKNNFILTSCKEKSKTVMMKRFNLNGVYEIAGILYELEKTAGIEKLEESIEKTDNKEKFKKYFQKFDEEKVEERLNCTTIKMVANLLQGKELSGDEKYFKKALLCAECFYDLQKQEVEEKKLLKEKQERKQKS